MTSEPHATETGTASHYSPLNANGALPDVLRSLQWELSQSPVQLARVAAIVRLSPHVSEMLFARCHQLGYVATDVESAVILVGVNALTQALTKLSDSLWPARIERETRQ